MWMAVDIQEWIQIYNMESYTYHRQEKVDDAKTIIRRRKSWKNKYRATVAAPLIKDCELACSHFFCNMNILSTW